MYMYMYMYIHMYLHVHVYCTHSWALEFNFIANLGFPTESPYFTDRQSSPIRALEDQRSSDRPVATEQSCRRRILLATIPSTVVGDECLGSRRKGRARDHPGPFLIG